MRTLWAVMLAVLPGLAFEYGLTPVKINERVYCYFGKPEVMNTHNNGNMVNSCFVDTGTSWLVVDSGPTYMYAKEAHLHVNRIKPMPVSYVINTHIHDDHWLGNGYYASLGAEVIGSFKFSNAFHSDETPRMAHRISPKAYAGTVPTIPNRLIKENLKLQINDLDVEIMNVDHKAHTDSDLLVYIPGIKTLFGGDLIFNAMLPSLRDGDINGWIHALDSIGNMDAITVIGGHGKLHDRNSPLMTWRYLTSLQNRVRTLIDEGVDIEEAVTISELPAFEDIALYDTLHRQNVEAAYRTLEWEDD